MPAFDDVPDAEVGVDADIDGATFNKFLNRDQYTKDVLDAVPASPRIVAQAVAVQTSGNGLGLTLTQHNYDKQTLVIVVGAPGDTDTVSAIPIAANRVILLGVSVAGGGTYDISRHVVMKGGVGTYVIRLTKAAGGTGTQTVTVNVYSIATG